MKMMSQREKGAKCMAEGGQVGWAKKKDVAKGVHEHEAALHKGSPKTPVKLAMGGVGKLRKSQMSPSGAPLKAPRSKIGRGI